MKSTSVLVLVAALTNSFASAAEIRFASWPEYGKNAGIAFAQESGIYEAIGLSTTIVDSFQNALILLEAGEADIAQVFCSAAIDGISRGLPARIIAVRDQRNPVATISKRGSGITSPADYAGKTWGHSAGFSPERTMLDKLMQLNGSGIGDIELVNLEFPARLPALLAGDVDFVSAWIGSGLPAVTLAARKSGAELDVVRWDEYGVDVYGECYVARPTADGTLPEWVSGWLDATRKGHAEAIAEPKLVGKTVLSLGPQVGQEEAFWLALEQGNELLLSEGMGADEILSVNLDKLVATAQWAGLDEANLDEMVAPEAVKN